MNIEDQELRERCLNLAADVFRGPSVTAQQLTTVAEHFFQYIKYGEDTEHDVEDEPTPPSNTGNGVAILRDALLRSRVTQDYAVHDLLK